MGVSALPGVGFLPGMVMAWAGSAAVPGWLLCDGSLLNQSDYPQLFGAIGVAYNIGGEPVTQFRLPNLKGKVIVMQDTAQAEFVALAQTGGEKAHVLALGEMPVHAHTITVNSVTVNGTSGAYTADMDRQHQHGLENHDHSINHWHTGNVAQTGWTGSTNHIHANHGGYGSEGPDAGNYLAGAFPINVDGTARAGPNGDNRSSWWTNPQGWQSANTGHLHNYDHGHSASGTASAATAGGGASHNNLQPYMTMNYLIKV
jgi:microcystin-dependent protein